MGFNVKYYHVNLSCTCDEGEKRKNLNDDINRYFYFCELQRAVKMPDHVPRSLPETPTNSFL